MRCRNWCFTLCAEFPKQLELLDFSDEANIRYAVYQLEVGATYTPHYQGYIEFKKSTRFNRCRALIPGAHFEPRKKSRDQARNYCMAETKEDGFRLDGPWEYGDWNTSPGERTDWKAILQQCKSGATAIAIAEDHPGEYARCFRGIEEIRKLYQVHRPASQETEVRLYYGTTGVGKSRAANERYPTAFWKEPATKWWDLYEGEETVILDEFRGNWMKVSQFLRLLDRYPLMVEKKGSHAKFRSKRIIITSNLLPTEWWAKVHSLERAALLRRFTHFHLFDGEGERVFGNYQLFEEQVMAGRSGQPVNHVIDLGDLTD